MCASHLKVGTPILNASQEEIEDHSGVRANRHVKTILELRAIAYLKPNKEM